MEIRGGIKKSPKDKEDLVKRIFREGYFGGQDYLTKRIERALPGKQSAGTRHDSS